MAKKKYRVTKPGLHIADSKGNVKALEVGEEFSHDALPEFWQAKVEEVNSTDEKSFEVATPKEKPSAKDKS